LSPTPTGRIIELLNSSVLNGSREDVCPCELDPIFWDRCSLTNQRVNPHVTCCSMDCVSPIPPCTRFRLAMPQLWLPKCRETARVGCREDSSFGCTVPEWHPVFPTMPQRSNKIARRPQASKPAAAPGAARKRNARANPPQPGGGQAKSNRRRRQRKARVPFGPSRAQFPNSSRSATFSRKMTVVEEDEYIGEVLGTTSTTVPGVTAYPINPGQKGTFPWLSK